MKSLHVKKGDRVKVISGKDRGAIGEIIAVDPQHDKVTVEGVNIVKRHLRDTPQQPQGRQVPGGIVSSEAPIHASNVQLVTQRGGKDVVSRVGYRREDVTKTRSDGSEYTATRSVRYLKADENKDGDK